MKKTILLTIVSLFFIMCSKEDPEGTDELNITLKSTTISNYQVVTPTFYPNPFTNYVTLTFGDSVNATINITTISKYKKLDISGRSFVLDFSNEEFSAYNCEILVNNKLFRTILINE